MATASPFPGPGRPIAGAAFLMAETFFTKGADYFREMSVLIVVFIPLELWRHAQITMFGVFQVLAASAALYLIGMACEWTSFGVRRGRQAWQEKSFQ